MLARLREQVEAEWRRVDPMNTGQHVHLNAILELIDAHSCAQQTLDNIRQAVADEPTLSWPGEIDDILDDEQRRLRAGATT